MASLNPPLPRAAVTDDPAVPAGSPRTRRNTEAALLVMSLAIGIFGWVSVDLTVNGAVPRDLWVVTGVLAGILLVAHLAVRMLAPFADPILLPTVSLLNLLGLVMIHRLDLADAQRAARNGGPAPSSDAVPQLTWTALGVALLVLVLVLVRDHRRLQRYTYTYMLTGLVLLLLPLVPGLGATINGATLWIRVGPLSFQPGELAKILLVLFFSGYLVVKRESLAFVRSKFLGIGLPRGRDLGPILVAWLVSLAVLIFERDLGTSLLFFGLFVSLLYIATQRWSWLVIGGVLFAAGAAFAYLAFGHVRVRAQIWLDPFAYQSDQGYQIVQALYGLANGGIFGTGLGAGYPQFVPFANSDFIITSFGEELGISGLFALLLLYGIVVERGLRTAVACRDPYGTLVAAGLSIVLALQVFVVVGGVTRLIPLTGLTTPFLSAGGSALVANWVMVALLLRISDTGRRPAPAITSPDLDLTTVVRP